MTEGSGAIVTVTASAPATADITVDFATADGTATVTDSDYVADTGTVIIPAGETTANVDATTNQDAAFEDDETFQIVLSNPSSNATIVDDTGAVTILNDDDPPATGASTLTIEDVTVDEDHSLLVRVVAEPAPSSPITVGWETVDGTATAGQDYTADSGTVTINANATIGAIGIGLHRDDDLEDPETFQIVLSDPSSNATIVDGTGVVTIVEGVCGTTLGLPIQFGSEPFNDLTCETPHPDTYHIHPDDPASNEVPADTNIRAVITNDAGATDLGMVLTFESSAAAEEDTAEVVAEPVLDGSGDQIGLQLDFTTPSAGAVRLHPFPDGTGASEVLYHLEISFPPPAS